jgi:transglutaminase-like putative cysteine protease
MKSITTKILLALFISLVYENANAQVFPEFGTVVKNEVEMTEYDKDKTAEAVVLYDFGKSRFIRSQTGFDVLFERRIKIKIFNKAGFNHAEVAIPYYKDTQFEKVYDVVGFTYNFENGKLEKTPLDISKMYDEKINEYWNQKKFAMPNVKEGSIIEYRYTIQSPYISQFRDWEFQSTIPVVYSEYETRMVPFYEYTYIMQGATKFDRFESYLDNGLETQFLHFKYKDMVYKFVMRDLPAFKDEEFITSKYDYIVKIDFQLSNYYTLSGAKIEVKTTWPKLSNDLLKDSYGQYLAASEKAAKKMLNYNELQGKNDVEKIEYVVNFVKSNFAWNGWYSKYPHKNVSDFTKAKTGYSTNVNLFLTGALRAAGINASPVLISTRSHGKIKMDYPFAHFFNSTIVLAKLENGMMLLDATEPASPYNMIPSECLNERGLVIEKNSDNWVELSRPVTSTLQHNFYINFNNELDSISSKIDIRSTGYYGVSQRKKYLDKTEKLTEYFYPRGFNVAQNSIKFTNLTDNLLPYIIRLDCSSRAESFGDKIYISPFLKEPLSENPFKQNSRTYPIDMVHSGNKLFSSTINIPSGYRIESLPPSYSFSNDQVDIEYKAMQNGDQVQVVGNYDFKKAMYSHNEYSRLKYFFNEIIRVFNEKVVLVKDQAN